MSLVFQKLPIASKEHCGSMPELPAQWFYTFKRRIRSRKNSFTIFSLSVTFPRITLSGLFALPAHFFKGAL